MKHSTAARPSAGSCRATRAAARPTVASRSRVGGRELGRHRVVEQRGGDRRPRPATTPRGARRSCGARASRAGARPGTAWSRGTRGRRPSANRRRGRACTHSRERHRRARARGCGRSSTRIIITGAVEQVVRPVVDGRRGRPAARNRCAPGSIVVPHGRSGGPEAGGRSRRVERRVGEARTEHGTEVVRQVPPGVDRRRASGVEVHLDRRGVAHHRAPRGPPRVEVLPPSPGSADRRGHAGASPRVSMAAPTRPRSWWSSSHRTRSVSARIASHASRSDGATGPLNSSWPPGSNVSRLPPGSAAGEHRGERFRQRGHAATARDHDPLELDADPSRLRGSLAGGEHLLVDESSDVGEREGAGRRGHRLAVPEAGRDPGEVPNRSRPEVPGVHGGSSSSADSTGGGSGGFRRAVPAGTGTLHDIRRYERARMRDSRKPYCATDGARLRDDRQRDGRRARREPVLATDPWIRGVGLLRELGALARGPAGAGRRDPCRRRGVVLPRASRPPQPRVAPALPRHPDPAARPRRRPDRARPQPRRVPGRGAARPDVGADLRPGAGAVHRRREPGRGAARRRRWPARGEPQRRAGPRLGIAS